MLTDEQITNVANWKHRLLYGNYEQSKDAMKNIYGYCCLGVAAETLGRDFKREQGDITYRYQIPGIEREFGGRLADDDAHKLGLDREITDEDMEFIENDYMDSMGLLMMSTREDVLIHLNDCDYTFPEIVEFVERIGWDR